MNEKIGWGIAAGVALLAWMSNPTITAHQNQVAALVQQAKSNALSNFDLGAYLSISVGDLARSGQYGNYIVMSKYVVLVGGAPAIECYGFFGQVNCVGAAPRK